MINKKSSKKENNNNLLHPKARRGLSPHHINQPVQQRFNPSSSPIFSNSTGIPESTRRIIWVHQLPPLVANPPSLAVKYCIRATSMAIYGQLTNDKSIQWAFHHWYILCLGHQPNSVRRMTAGATGTQVFLFLEKVCGEWKWKW